VAAWVAGLASWPANLALNATNAQVAAAYRAHPAGAASQYLLAEGLAALLLGVVLAAALIANRDRGRARPWPAAATAAGAVAISLLQAVIGMFLIAAATHHDIVRAGGLSDLVNRLDGVKMLALAAVAAYLAARRTWDRRPPNWLTATAALAAAALAVSGLDYVLLANSLAWTVYISGPLLLAWIAATGIWLTRGVPAATARLCAWMRGRRPGQATYSSPLEPSAIASFFNPVAAGPTSTAPVLALNCEPWHGQTITFAEGS
jgi:hypothetical protein